MKFLSLEMPSVAEAWVAAMQQVFFDGVPIKSQYDEPGDLPTMDVTSAIFVTEPFSNPYGVRNKPIKIDGMLVYCHPADLYCIESIKSGYITEVMAGDKDHYIWERDQHHSFPYTYHDRLRSYLPANEEDREFDEIADLRFGEYPKVDQIEEIIKKLKGSPISRRSQAITWRPLADNIRSDPPCLQRIWCRVFGDELRFNTHWRSRDLFGAWGANVNGMLHIARHIANELGIEKIIYFDMCDSLHIYGKKKKLIKEVLPMFQRIQKREGLLKPEYEDRLDELLESFGVSD